MFTLWYFTVVKVTIVRDYHNVNEALTLLAIEKFFKVLLLGCRRQILLISTGCHNWAYCCSHYELFEGVLDMWIILKNLWSPHNPDLSPCDFFLWGYMKDKVSTHNPTSSKGLKVKITQIIHSTDTRILGKVFPNRLKRAVACREVG